MKKYIKMIFCVGILFLSNACNDSFLDEKVLDKYSPEALKDKLGFEAAIVGLHQQFGTHLKSTDDQTIYEIWDIGTDIAWAPAGRANGMPRPYFDYTAMNSQDQASLRVWRYLYKLINNANAIVTNAEDATITAVTETDKNLYNAEAKFFRAYAYNVLATLYGDVPLETTPTTFPRTDYVRAPVADVNKLIEEDLLFAVANLPKIGSAPSGGRANMAMARQLLAEVYLRIGEDAKAEAQCLEIINGNSGSLSLIKSRYGVNATKPGDPFSDMFIFGNQRRSQGNTEAIWVYENENPTDKPYSSDSPQQRRNWVAGYYDIPGMLPTDSLGGRGIQRIRLNNWVLYQLYEQTDMRNSSFNIRRKFYFNNTGANYSNIFGKPVPAGQDQEIILADGTTKIKISKSDTIWRLAPYTTKWNQFDPRDTFGYGMWKDFILMRLAETYLLLAEAQHKQGKFLDALATLNVIRERANATPATLADIGSNPNNINYILDERARELLAEERRRMTLVRTGTLVDRAKTLSGTAPLAGGNIETTNGLTEKNLLLPIPQSEIDLNKDAVLTQNPGY
jgi:starch-binding outer membrane protein, SusD/RagB family